MPRSSFGGSQDLSMVFASFYREYADRLEEGALRAERRAEEEQAAADNDTIDRWQQGELTDEEFLAYAAERVAATGDDPERNAYWKRVQRDAEKSILVEEVSDTAEDLVNQVEAGTKTWADLLAYYKQAQKSLRPSDPLYEDLSKQIEQVNDRIRDNEIAGAFERVQYQFESGQMTGQNAGAQLRSLAERYRVNDPARYYQILQQALDLERYGGFFSASGAGGGGGSGRGSSAKPLNNLIDALQGMEDRIGSLSEQYEDGVRIGAITVENEDGSLSTEEVLLTNPDGTPSRQMQQLDGQMLDTLGRLEQAYIEKGDRSAAGETANRRMQFITDHIQPRNTVAPQQQAASLLQAGLSLVEQAADSDDPVLAWGKVQGWARRVSDWERRLNTTVTQTPSGRQFSGDELRANPELKATQLTTKVRGDPLEGQTTGEFKDQAGGLRDFAAAVANGDSAGVASALDSFAPEGEESVSHIAQRVTAAIDLVTGIPTGKYVRAYVPGEGLVYAPVQPTYTTEIGDDGQPQTVLRSVPVRPDGSPLADGNRGEELVDVMVQINGRAQMVKGVAQPSFFVGGQAVSPSEYAQVFRDYQQATPEEQANGKLRDGTVIVQPQQYRQVLIPGRNGARPQNWIYDSGRELWFKDRVTKYGGVPLVFVGNNPRLAQQAADKLGIDPKGTSYYNEPLETQKATVRKARDDWYHQATTNARSEFQRQSRAQAASAFRAGRAQLGVAANVPIVSDALKQFGAQLGIKSFDAPETRPATLPTLSATAPTPSLSRITLPQTAEQTMFPKVALPRLTLPKPPTTTTTTAPRLAASDPRRLNFREF